MNNTNADKGQEHIDGLYADHILAMYRCFVGEINAEATHTTAEKLEECVGPEDLDIYLDNAMRFAGKVQPLITACHFAHINMTPERAVQMILKYSRMSVDAIVRIATEEMLASDLDDLDEAPGSWIGSGIEIPDALGDNE